MVKKPDFIEAHCLQIPITIQVLSGFLGSGKTTAVVRLLRAIAKEKRVAVIVNEFGEVDIDGETIGEAVKEKVELYKMAGGCVCCSAASGFLIEVERLVAANSAEHIIIEPTGVARPSEIIDVLRRTKFAREVQILPTICFVDPRWILSEDVIKVPIILEQVDGSEIIVANFSDQISDVDKHAMTLWYEALYPRKEKFLLTAHSDTPVEWFLQPSVRRAGFSEPQFYEISQGSPKSPLRIGATMPVDSGEKGIHAFAHLWPPTLLFRQDKVSALFHRLATEPPPGLLRIKGIFQTPFGGFRFEVAGAPGKEGADLSLHYSSHRSDSRVDCLVLDSEKRNWLELPRWLEDCAFTGTSESI